MRFRWLVVLVALFSLCVALQALPDPSWTRPVVPFRIVGNLYYVGSEDLASYLIVTPKGNILINSDLATSVPMIKRNVEKLGFRFSDTKILLISHAHYDHCGGSALVKKLTGAQYMVMDADVPSVEDGGRSDFFYAHDRSMYFPPAHVDRVLHDGDTVSLGGMVLVAHITPGHTKGCTTWTLRVADGGRTYNVVIVGSPNVLDGYKLVGHPSSPASYPGIAADFALTFKTMKALPCDVFLGAHGGYFDLTGKMARMGKGGNPFIDPAGYRAYVAETEGNYLRELQKQQSGR